MGLKAKLRSAASPTPGAAGVNWDCDRVIGRRRSLARWFASVNPYLRGRSQTYQWSMAKV